MARAYLKEVGTTGSRINDSRQGLGLDRDRSEHIENPSQSKPLTDASDYLTDGRGNVRIVGSSVTSSDQLSGISS